jgi:hypothetical protein
MPAYAGAFVIRNALVSFAATDFTNQCTKARLVPETPTQTLRTLVPDGAIVDVDSTVWTLELSGIQDWETGGFAAYCNTNNGALVAVTIAPQNTTAKRKATISARVVPVPFGGDQGKFADFDLTLACNGQPVIAALP